MGIDGNGVPRVKVQIVGALGTEHLLPLTRVRVWTETKTGPVGLFTLATNLKGPCYLVFTDQEEKTWQTPLILTENETLKLRVILAPFSISFEDTSTLEPRFVEYFNRFLGMKQEHDKSVYDHFSAGGSYSDFKFDPTPMLQTIHGELAIETAPLLRQELLLEYLDMAMLSTSSYDTTTVRALVSHVPANSPTWVYHGLLPLTVSPLLSDSAAFVRDVISQSESNEYSALLLYRLCSYAERAGDVTEAVTLFDRLVGGYHDTEPARSAEQVLRPEARLYVGASLPDFAFVSVSDTTQVYTNGSFRNKFLLFDFWATWCPPCVQEMKFLDKAYRQFPDSQIEIVSVSFDESLSAVRTFEKAKFRIPWNSTYVSPEKQPDVSLLFNVGAFPSLILADPSGHVVQTGDALQGDTLLKTLSEYLQKPR